MKQIGIIYGGKSAEHEVSCLSANEVFRNIDLLKFNPHKFFISKDGDFEFEIANLIKMDSVFIALHGNYGEDGKIQGFFETLKIPYTGPNVFSSAIGMDKFLSKEIWLKNNLPIIPHKIVDSPELCDDNIFPFVLKPKNSGSSFGVHIVKNTSEIKSAFDDASKYGKVMQEKYIKGRELTVALLANEKHKLNALPIVEIIPTKEFYDYDAKYIRDDTQYIVPAKISAELSMQIQNAAILAAESLGIDTYSRIDVMLDEKDNFYLMEINTLPGMTSHSLLPKAANACGITYTDLISRMINLSFK